MNLTRLFMWIWAGWIAYFAAAESTAFAIGRRDLTLSDFTWRFEGSGYTLARYLVAAGMIWATAHLVWGLFR